MVIHTHTHTCAHTHTHTCTHAPTFMHTQSKQSFWYFWGSGSKELPDEDFVHGEVGGTHGLSMLTVLYCRGYLYNSLYYSVCT